MEFKLWNSPNIRTHPNNASYHLIIWKQRTTEPQKKEDLAEGTCLQCLPNTADPSVFHTALDLLEGHVTFNKWKSMPPLKTLLP